MYIVCSTDNSSKKRSYVSEFKEIKMGTPPGVTWVKNEVSWCDNPKDAKKFLNTEAEAIAYVLGDENDSRDMYHEVRAVRVP